jgi:hypothetical protein
MLESRTATALVVGIASIAVSVLLYAYTGSLVFFLFLPFVPFLFSNREDDRRPEQRPVFECPRCGFRTRNPEFEYCPRDGSRLDAKQREETVG